MVHDVPPELAALLSASDAVRREQAWAEFVNRHSRLILHVSRSHGGDRDAVMDRYAFILERLHDDDLRRLRTWTRERRSQFTTWLTVVAQRASLDLYRSRYGRPRDDSSSSAERIARRRLADLLVDEIVDERLSDDSGNGATHPELSLRSSELVDRLHEAVRGIPAEDQLLLALRYRDSLTAAQIARTLNYPSQFQVYRRLDRVLATLRLALRRRGVEDATP
jgi:RNA polymerase sigma factor (sigma-70 family)